LCGILYPTRLEHLKANAGRANLPTGRWLGWGPTGKRIKVPGTQKNSAQAELEWGRAWEAGFWRRGHSFVLWRLNLPNSSDPRTHHPDCLRRGEPMGSCRGWLLLWVLSISAMALGQDLCPTPNPQKTTCSAGKCNQTIYPHVCTNIYNEEIECVDWGNYVLCCGGQIPTMDNGICGIGIGRISKSGLDMLAREIGGTRVFAPTCSGGYRRLAGSPRPAAAPPRQSP
jgi:hypothetical protein